MTESERLPIVLWTISCFDRTREKPFPLFNRVFAIDWTIVPENEKTDVLNVIRKDPSKHKPVGFDTSIVTISHGPRPQNDAILRFRTYFKLLSDEEFTAICGDTTANSVHVGVGREYTENESGKEITVYEMIQHVSGQEHPVIMGNVESILRLGESPPSATDEWCISTANTISQFLDVVERICASAWHRRQKSTTWRASRGAVGSATELNVADLLEAVFPDAEETTSILAYFRQLHGGDKLLLKAVQAYSKHCSDGRKLHWVSYESQVFAQLTDRAPGFLESKRSRRQIIRLFMYGAGLLHSESNDGAGDKLAEFVNELGKEAAVMIFNNCLVDLLGPATRLYHPIKLDFDHWVASHSLEAPNRQKIASLFQSFTSDPS